MKDPYKETIISINKSGNPTFMTTSKSIEEIIKDEYQLLIMTQETDEWGGKEFYIAGRSQNLAREKDYREALEEIKTAATFGQSMDDDPRNEIMNAIASKAKQLLNKQ